MAALAKDLLVKNCDFSEFKKSQSSLKSLENFIAESLKIHVDYQIAVHNKEKLSYSENPNELDLNQIDIESSHN
ncbi:16006_t:CDS:2, partial [Dentiscutata erythropus]